MAATQPREIALSNSVSMFAMKMLAQEEGLDAADIGACVDVFIRRTDEVTRFHAICHPLVKEIDRPGIDLAVAERLILEALATAWHQFKQELR